MLNKTTMDLPIASVFVKLKVRIPRRPFVVIEARRRRAISTGSRPAAAATAHGIKPVLDGAQPRRAAGIVADAGARGAKGRHAGVGAEAGGVGGGLAGVDGRGHAGAVGVVEGDAGGGARGEDVGVGEGGDGGDG